MHTTAENLKEDFDGYDDKRVTRLAEHTPQRLRHSHHLEGSPVHLERFTYRVNVREEALLDIVADKAAPELLVVVDIRQESPLSCLVVTHGPYVGRHTLNARAVQPLIPETQIGLTAALQTNIRNELRPLPYEVVLLAIEPRILTLQFQKFLGIPIANKGEADDTKAIRAHVRNAFGDVPVHAVDHAHHGNEGGGGEDNSQQSEKTPQLTRA